MFKKGTAVHVHAQKVMMDAAGMQRQLADKRSLTTSDLPSEYVLKKREEDEAALQEKSFPFDPFDLSNAHNEPCQLQKLKSFHDVMIDSDDYYRSKHSNHQSSSSSSQQFLSFYNQKKMPNNNTHEQVLTTILTRKLEVNT
jgi:hypothetical protein